ncbi:lipopolysaccharide biosynthesis protein [Luteococcus sp. Sow4_B9]|uniref:lipopolysaccharide biosynthesis protein n=1 Tax=Luteococcus sp. Sow4_B9 TaxID=3438792 RepID=UPI003F9608DC
MQDAEEDRLATPTRSHSRDEQLPTHDVTPDSLDPLPRQRPRRALAEPHDGLHTQPGDSGHTQPGDSVHTQPGDSVHTHPGDSVHDGPPVDDRPDQADLGSTVATGAKWSIVGNIISRAGTLIVGIVVANLVTPDQMGVFSVAMMVGMMTLTFADMGLGADLVRSDDETLKRKIPTTATMGLLFCGLGTALIVGLSNVIGNGLGVPESSPLIRVYAFSVLLSGIGLVPFSILQRNIDQKRIFIINMVNFVVSNGLSLALLLGTGMGVLALPIGAVIGQACQISLMYWFTRWRPTFGLDRSLVRSVLAFGVPVAGSNLMQVLVTFVDRIIVAPLRGKAALGQYTMAANISNWPVSVLGMAVRSIALPAFAKSDPRKGDPALTLGVSITWMLSLPMGVMLAIMARPVILFVYNPQYLPAITLLSIVGMYGAIRVVFDTLTGYLYARGDSRGVFWANLVWTIALFLFTYVATKNWGAKGAAGAQIFTAVLVALPIFLWSVHRAGGRVGGLLATMIPTTLACVPAGVLCWLTLNAVESMNLFTSLRLRSFVELTVGGLVFVAVYAPLVLRRLKRQIATMRADEEVPAEAA